MKPFSAIQRDLLAGVYQLIVPETILVGFACALLVVGLFLARRTIAVRLAALGIVSAFLATLLRSSTEVSWFTSVAEGYSASGISPFDPTGPSTLIRFAAYGFSLLFLLVSWREIEDAFAAEYAACLLVVTAGLSLLGSVDDLVPLFLALEMISIPTYLLLYLPARSRAGEEATIKYFLLSVFSSAIFLFGASYLYGMTGTTNLRGITRILLDAHRLTVEPATLLGLLIAVAGLSFRLAAVPFHFYAPDVYQAGPTGVIAQLAVVPKFAGCLALARILGVLAPESELPFQSTMVPTALWVIAAATATLGNTAALLQSDLKRLLAYSGIAHSGYLLIALMTASAGAASAVDAMLIYLVAYGFMNVGAFATISHLETLGLPAKTTDDLSGLGRTRPESAFPLAIALAGMMGLPLTAGFFGKFLIVSSAFELPSSASHAGMVRGAAIVVAINAAIGAVYYLKLVSTMYFREPVKSPQDVIPNYRTPAWYAAVICAAGTLFFGIYPKPLSELVSRSTTPHPERPIDPASPLR